MRVQALLLAVVFSVAMMACSGCVVHEHHYDHHRHYDEHGHVIVVPDHHDYDHDHDYH